MLRLILVIKELKYHRPNQTIITIYNNHNFSISTVVCSCFVYVLKCLLILLVLDEFDLILLDVILVEVLSDFLGRPVLWGIVDVDNVIVCVGLLKDRVEVFYVIVWVLVAWNNQAEWQLPDRVVVGQLWIMLLVVFSLFLEQGLQLLLFSCTWGQFLPLCLCAILLFTPIVSLYIFHYMSTLFRIEEFC